MGLFKKKKEKTTYSTLFVAMMVINITCLIVSNIIVIKTANIFGLIFAASNILYPITYVFDDVFAEVYGFKKARFVTWMSFLCNLIAVIFFAITIAMPPSSEFQYQSAIETVLGNTPRVLVASFISFLLGSLANAAVLSKLKVWTEGKMLFLRTIGSTLVGEFIDSIIFFPIAFYGTISNQSLVHLMVNAFCFKVALETLMTPFTYFVIGKVKKWDGIDTYDHGLRYRLFR